MNSLEHSTGSRYDISAWQTRNYEFIEPSIMSGPHSGNTYFVRDLGSFKLLGLNTVEKQSQKLSCTYIGILDDEQIQISDKFIPDTDSIEVILFPEWMKKEIASMTETFSSIPIKDVKFLHEN